jgi:hypothetical protein
MLTAAWKFGSKAATMFEDLRQQPPQWALALPRFEATLGLIDDVDAALATHDTIVAVTAAQRFQWITDFHNTSCLLGAGFTDAAADCQ